MVPAKLAPGAAARSLLYGCLLIFCSLRGATQSIDYRALDYGRIDSLVLTAGRKHDRSPGHLAQFIRNTFPGEHERARAIFTWMAHHIRYDVKAYHKPRKARSRYDQVFRRKRGLCGGYANLFEALCGLTGVESVVIEGYAREGGEKKIGVSQRRVNHAWNAVKLGGHWYPLDVTWGSGYTNYHVTKFFPYFDKTYFLARPQQFIVTHYPKDISWQLVGQPLAKKEFDFFPVPGEGFYQNQIEAFSPANGVIRTEAGCQLQFRFKTYDDYPLHCIVIATYRDSDDPCRDTTESLPLFREADGYYAFYYDVPRKGSYLLSIKINYRHTLVYRVIARQ
jgi:hypothetical protein